MFLWFNIRNVNSSKIVWMLGAIFVSLVAHQTLGFSGSGQLVQALNNALHVPWFAFVAGAVWFAFDRPKWMWVITACLGVSLISELLQLYTSRTASINDVVLDMIGASATVAILELHKHRKVSRGLLWSGFLLIIILIPLAAPLRVIVAEEMRDRRFPQLFRVTAVLWDPLVVCNSDCILEQATGDWNDHTGDRVLNISLSNTQYPGITLREVVPDWSDYHELVVELWVTGDSPMSVNVAVGHVGTPGTAAYVAHTLAPGAHELHIPLKRLAYNKDGRSASISKVLIYSYRRFAGREFLLAKIGLR